MLRRPVADIEAMPSDEIIAWGLIMDYVAGPLDWRRSDLLDARQCAMQCAGESGTLEDFLLWPHQRPELSAMEELARKESQMRMFEKLFKPSEVISTEEVAKQNDGPKC